MLSVQNIERRLSQTARRQHLLRRFESLENRICLSTAEANWGATIGNDGSDSVEALAVDNDGNAYTAATVASVGDEQVTLFRHSPTGAELHSQVVWRTTAGQSLDITDLAVAPDGHLFIVGSFGGDIDLDPDSAGGELSSGGGDDGFVAKYTSDLSLVWSQRLGGSADDEINALALTASHVYLVGTFQETISLGSTEVLSSTVGEDRAGFLVKLADQSTRPDDFVWSTQIQDSGTVSMSDVVVAESGSTAEVFVTGTFGARGNGRKQKAVFDGQVMKTGRDFDAFVVKYHSDSGAQPAVEWAYQIAESDGNGLSRVVGLARSPTGDLYVAGSFRGYPTDFGIAELTPLSVYENFWNEDGYVLRLDDSGDTPQAAWIRQIQCQSHLSVRAIVLSQGATPSVFIAGRFSGTAEFDPPDTAAQKTASHGMPDAFLLELNPDSGGYIDVWQIGAEGAEGDDYAVALSVDGSGSVYLAGESAGSLIPTPGGTLESAGSDDVMLVHVNPSAPQLRILQRETLIEQQQSQLSVSATDRLDGDLSEHVVWTGTLDGHVINHTGSTLSLPSPLHLGRHELTVAVTNSSGVHATYVHRFDVTPNSPSSLTANVVPKGKNSTITLTWFDNSINEEGFCIEYNNPMLTLWWETLATVGPDTTEYSHLVSKNVRTISYRVRSFATSSNGRLIVSPVTEVLEVDPSRRGTVAVSSAGSLASLTEIGSALNSLPLQRDSEPAVPASEVELDQQSQMIQLQILAPITTGIGFPTMALGNKISTAADAIDAIFAELNADSLEGVLDAQKMV